MDLTIADHLLTTTRSVRKRLDFDRPVAPEVIERCIEIATQAPTGSNTQGWHFLVITDPDTRAQVSAFYRQSFELYAAAGSSRAPDDATDPHVAQMFRVRDSAIYLAEHMHRAPALIIPCIAGRVENAGTMAQAGTYGSILPATWSLMLALRARGLGSAWTTLHLRYEQEVAALLGIPENMTQAALLPVAYIKGGDLRPALRRPAREVTSWNGWGRPRGDDIEPAATEMSSQS